jgi:oligosaccharide reducing-end xylanase
VASALLALASCTSTRDSLGYNGAGGAAGVRLHRLSDSRTYPNPFKDLGKTDKEIADKIAATWNQLFYGDAGLQAIYVPMGADQAYIFDTLHMDIRTEGIGLAMMIAVQLDKRGEFDRLWRYADTERKHQDGPRRGYFASSCDNAAGVSAMPCDDPYGAQQMLTALIFAHDRWGSETTINYEAGAVDLLTVMRHKEDENGGLKLEGITNTFDTKTALPFHLPLAAQSDVSRPSIVMPAYYDLWFEATGDPFWTRAAKAGRDYWKKTAHPETGLTPVQASLEGEPVELWEDFRSESYRAQINMALDWLWAKGEKDPWEVAEADRLLKFFTEKGMGTYGGGYSLDGTQVVDAMRDQALVVANGITGILATGQTERDAYIETVFDMATPTGPARYYSGILDLTALLMLSGQYRVW